MTRCPLPIRSDIRDQISAISSSIMIFFSLLFPNYHIIRLDVHSVRDVNFSDLYYVCMYKWFMRACKMCVHVLRRVRTG